MSNTHRTHANSAGHSGQPSTAMPSGSTSQAANAALLAPAKLQFQYTKFELCLLDNNGDNYMQWCKMTTLMLKYKGLWDIIDGSTPSPVPADAQAHLKWT